MLLLLFLHHGQSPWRGKGRRMQTPAHGDRRQKGTRWGKPSSPAVSPRCLGHEKVRGSGGRDGEVAAEGRGYSSGRDGDESARASAPRTPLPPVPARGALGAGSRRDVAWDSPSALPEQERERPGRMASCGARLVSARGGVDLSAGERAALYLSAVAPHTSDL